MTFDYVEFATTTGRKVKVDSLWHFKYILDGEVQKIGYISDEDAIRYAWLLFCSLLEQEEESV